jgi:biotin-(acetyl-CoA carboxylase) ligase
MPLETPVYPRVGSAEELALPPPYTQVRLRELGDAFAHAIAIAAERGGGTFVYVGRFDLAEFAVVLEPEEPLAQARRGFYACMTGLAEALIANAEPETNITIGWPDSISVNGGLVGGGRLAWPAGTREDAPPDWMVFGAMIRTATLTETEPGLNPLVTTLSDEGFSALAPNLLMESFARNLMVALDAWQESGFGTVAKNFLARLPRDSGVRRDIDDNGDLLIRRMGKTETQRRKLIPALAVPSWFDPEAGGPK